MKLKYYLLSIMLVLSVFTIIIPILYYVLTGSGIMNLQEKVMEKYHPELYNNLNRRKFWTPW